MNLYIWRHNKTYHSHSMINEPCVVNEFYLDALAIVEAETLDDALFVRCVAVLQCDPVP